MQTGGTKEAKTDGYEMEGRAASASDVSGVSGGFSWPSPIGRLRDVQLHTHAAVQVVYAMTTHFGKPSCRLLIATSTMRQCAQMTADGQGVAAGGRRIRSSVKMQPGGRLLRFLLSLPSFSFPSFRLLPSKGGRMQASQKETSPPPRRGRGGGGEKERKNVKSDWKLGLCETSVAQNRPTMGCIIH